MNRDKKVENYAHLNQSDFGAISLGLSDEYEDMPEHFQDTIPKSHH
jgi:hypothetical protein